MAVYYVRLSVRVTLAILLETGLKLEMFASVKQASFNKVKYVLPVL